MRLLAFEAVCAGIVTPVHAPGAPADTMTSDFFGYRGRVFPQGCRNVTEGFLLMQHLLNRKPLFKGQMFILRHPDLPSLPE